MPTIKEHLDALTNRAEGAQGEKETEIEHLQEAVEKLVEFQDAAQTVSRELENLSELQEELERDYETDLDE
tara:strand:+ start:558 stop:770 length:213 start_codon:yes stop_codon:yes gene_type:complete